jgi:hypothetical protein
MPEYKRRVGQTRKCAALGIVKDRITSAYTSVLGKAVAGDSLLSSNILNSHCHLSL